MQLLAGPWPFRVAWAVVAVGAGPAFADALADRSRAVQLVASVGLWAGWTAVLAASLVPRAATLTVVRLAAPAPLAAAVAAAVAGPFGADDAVALSLGGLALAASLLPGAVDAFVDGSSYGAERRFALRAPVVLLVAAAPVAWALAVVAPAAAALLLAARSWVPGGALAVVGAAGVRLGVPAVHRLSRRWLVFVPAGLVVHDHLLLADPVLFRLPSLAEVRPGPERTVELVFAEPTEIVFAEGWGAARQAVPRTIDRLPAAPLRPAAVLAEARDRRYPVATAEPTTTSPS